MGGFKSNSRAWVASETKRLDNAIGAMAKAMVNRGQMLAPVLSGDLKDSGRVVKNGVASYSAVFGGANVGVPYARRREFENYKNPHTKHYSKRSGDSVVKEG